MPTLLDLVKRSKYISSSIKTLDERLGLLSTQYENDNVFIFPDVSIVNMNELEKEMYVWDWYVEKLNRMKDGIFTGYYEITASEENKEYTDFIQSCEKETMEFKHKVLVNVVKEFPTHHLPNDSYFMLYKLDVKIKGSFDVINWDIYPKITHWKITNPKTVRYILSGVLESVEFDSVAKN